MAVPIIIPVPQYVPPPRCPSCNNLENIKRICANCGFEYHDAALSWLDISFMAGGMIVGIFAFMWLLITTMYWIFEDYPRRHTLAEVIGLQWKWVKGIRLW